MSVCKMKGLIVHLVVREPLCGILKVFKLVIERVLELMASTLGSTFGKEEVGV